MGPTALKKSQPSTFDIIQDIVHIEKDGLMISESLTESLSVIAQAKGISINVIVANILWEGVHSYNKKIAGYLSTDRG